MVSIYLEMSVLLALIKGVVKPVIPFQVVAHNVRMASIYLEIGAFHALI